MILVSSTKLEYVDESRILVKQSSPGIFAVLAMTRWRGDTVSAIGPGYTKEIADIISSYKDITAEAIEVYNDYTMAKIR